MSANFAATPNDFDRDAIAIVFQRPPGNRTPDRDLPESSLHGLPSAVSRVVEPMR
jgi:hypothetical protein